MAEKYVLGLKSVKFGIPTGDSSMPTEMEPFAKTVRGTMTISESEPTVQDFYVEEQDAPVEQSITESSKLEVTWKAYDMSAATLEKVKGGTAVEDNGVDTPESYTAPAKTILKKLALEIETNTGSKYLIPKANVIARIDGTIGREDMLQVEVTATALDPGDGKGPWTIEWPMQS